MIDWLGQKVGIYGYGKTGKALVDFMLPQMISPIVLVDSASPEIQKELAQFSRDRHEYAVGEDISAVINQIESLVLSPGVPLSNPNVQLAKSRGIPVVSELELAARFCPGYIIAVTGTNGKSTTTKLLGHVLSALAPAHVLGNIGDPLIGSIDQIAPDDFVALEVSSYQLEATDGFAPRIAIYTNLTPDHLDRHGTLEEYARVKRSMTDRMGSGDFVITNALCDEFSPESFANQQPKYLQYRSTPGNRLIGAWTGNDKINIDLGHEQYELPVSCIKLPGNHNVENAMAVILASLLVGATPETISERLCGFTEYEHRLELCRTSAGIQYYNDSKATNPEATITALKAMEKPLVLILGGRDKMTDLSEMCRWVQRTAAAVVLYGEAASRFNEELNKIGYNSVSRVENLEEAVSKATGLIKATGGRVVLSPACSSFDQYVSYEARGDHFKEIVDALDL